MTSPTINILAHKPGNRDKVAILRQLKQHHRTDEPTEKPDGRLLLLGAIFIGLLLCFAGLLIYAVSNLR